jgi:hypothetical protein
MKSSPHTPPGDSGWTADSPFTWYTAQEGQRILEKLGNPANGTEVLRRIEHAARRALLLTLHPYTAASKKQLTTLLKRVEKTSEALSRLHSPALNALEDVQYGAGVEIDLAGLHATLTTLLEIIPHALQTHEPKPGTPLKTMGRRSFIQALYDIWLQVSNHKTIKYRIGIARDTGWGACYNDAG